MATSIRPLTSIPNVLSTVGDPEGTRTVTSIVALLVALGLGLAMVAIWLYRATRPDPELLAPLEVMGERRWRRADPVWQRRRLDELRPPGARPLSPSVAPPDIDEAFDEGPAASGFDDLHGEEPVIEALPPPTSGSLRQEVRPPVDAPTPESIERPRLDELPDREFDPAALAAALVELEAELRRRATDDGSTTTG